MSSEKKIQINIVGLIATVSYQKAKLCAEKLFKYQNSTFGKPYIRGMLEFDWQEYITKQRKIFGGRFWALRRSVAVYCNNEFIGNDVDLLRYIQKSYAFSILHSEKYFSLLGRADYELYLTNTRRRFAYFYIEIENGFKGTMVFQLYSDLLPKTCRRFSKFCDGYKSESKQKDSSISLYKSRRIYRVCKHGWIQCGDMIDGDVHGERKLDYVSRTFPDENYCISHDRRGVLSFVNDGKHNNSTQFFVTLQPCPWMNYHYVAFGQLVEGVNVLEAIESVTTYYEKPLKSITIVKCGTFYPFKEMKKVLQSQPVSVAKNIILSILRRTEKSKGIEEREEEMIVPSFAENITDMQHQDCSEAVNDVIQSVMEAAGNMFSVGEPVLFNYDVTDPRDVPSFLSKDSYLKGLYYID